MKGKISPLKFFDLLVVTILILGFVFFPSAPSRNQSQVRSATTTRTLILPQPLENSSPAPDLTAAAVYIIDPDSGTVIYVKNSQAPFYPASTTKLMTALVALKSFASDQVLTVKSAQNATGQTMKLRQGDQLTVENLLYGLLVDSGNDAGVALAENYPTGYTQFIAKMNQQALDLGLTSTHFTNVTGLINPDHYTSARDLTLIANEAIKNATIRRIVSTKHILITDITGKRKFDLESTNKLLGLNGIKGLKTGWTPESGECLVTLVTRDGKSILVTLLNSKDRFGESVKLIDWVYANFTWNQI